MLILRLKDDWTKCERERERGTLVLEISFLLDVHQLISQTSEDGRPDRLGENVSQDV